MSNKEFKALGELLDYESEKRMARLGTSWATRKKAQERLVKTWVNRLIGTRLSSCKSGDLLSIRYLNKVISCKLFLLL